MDVKVNWHGRLTFTGTADSGFEVPLGTEPKVGGDDDGFRPMELMALSIAGCTAMDVISIMIKKRQDVTDFEVKVHTEQAEKHPKVFTIAKIEYIFSGHDIDEAAAVRSIELSAIRYCPAQGMLAKIMPFDLRYQIYEDLGDGERKLVTTGKYLLPDA
ncbi:MAG: OsmC family protein [Anaerolineales bacterium]|nr:OsmC family protein [Anaerolineales bacterium]